jgi:integrase
MSNKNKFIYKRPDSPYWQYSFSIRGKGRFRGSTGIEDEVLAERYTLKLKKELYEGVFFHKKPEIKLEQALIRYWIEHASKLSSNESQKYRLKHYKDFFCGKFGLDFLLSDLDDGNLHDFIQWRKATPIKNTNPIRFVSDGTIRKEISTLDKLNKMAKAKWKVSSGDINITIHNEELGNTRDLKNHILPAKQVTAINELPDYLKDPVLFMRLSGLRWGNVKKLDKSQIDWASGIIVFSVKTPRKRIKEKLHIIPIDQYIKVLLLRNGCEEGAQESGLVFTYIDREGVRRELGDHRKAIIRAYKAAGVEVVRGQVTHLWRHTVGTAIMDNSKDIRQVQAGLGHSNITTSAKYTHLGKDMQQIMAVSLQQMSGEFFELLQPVPLGTKLARSESDTLEGVMKIGSNKGKNI